jgi:hypothetical protein
MKCLLSTIWLLLAFTMADGAPAQPRYEPPEAPKSPPGPLELSGTVWDGVFFGGPARITLHPDGTLTYRHNAEVAPGLWRGTGADTLYIEINRYSEHRGTLKGNVIQGHSTNRGGMTGEFRLQRVIPGMN